VTRAVAAAATPPAVIMDAIARLEQAGIERARDSAEWLLAAVLGTGRFEVYLEPRRPLSPAQVERYRALVARRAAREPLQHLLGFEGFDGLRLEVGPDVLIPRPETEGLERPRARVADVGTGRGAIACALAVRFPGVEVVAIDRSPAALAVAARNARAHGLADRVRLVAGDLLEPLAGPVDVIVANLPYIPGALLPALPPEVSRWEPRAALDGGPDGLSVLRRLVMAAPRALAPGGSILLEIGEEQAGPLASLMAAEGFCGIRSRRDGNDVERYVGARWHTEVPPEPRRAC
jgi:release factor glutamine methyltransferase